jgi:hypothetical protein
MATPQFVPFPDAAEATGPFSPVDAEPPLRWQRAVHLAPARGLGVLRRVIFFALLTWLPIAIWALVRGRFLDAVVGEPLLKHYGVHNSSPAESWARPHGLVSKPHCARPSGGATPRCRGCS